MIINNYWVRLSKISWLVSAKQINNFICWSQMLRQIIDLCDTDKSWYFVITEFKNYFITWSLLFWSTKVVKSLSDRSGKGCAIFTWECGFNRAWVEQFICRKTLICRQLFAGHIVGFRPMKTKEKIYRMIITIIVIMIIIAIIIVMSVPSHFDSTSTSLLSRDITHSKFKSWGLLGHLHKSSTLQIVDSNVAKKKQNKTNQD